MMAPLGIILVLDILLPPVVVFYYTMVAFLTAEFTASLEWQIEFFFLGFPPGDGSQQGFLRLQE